MSKGITVIPCGASSTAARTRPRLYERRRRLPAIPRNVTAGRELAGCIDEPPPVWGSQGTLAIMTLDVGLFLDEEADGVRTYGDIARFEDALREVLER